MVDIIRCRLFVSNYISDASLLYLVESLAIILNILFVFQDYFKSILLVISVSQFGLGVALFFSVIPH